jgi:hypothetical protein
VQPAAVAGAKLKALALQSDAVIRTIRQLREGLQSAADWLILCLGDDSGISREFTVSDRVPQQIGQRELTAMSKRRKDRLAMASHTRIRAAAAICVVTFAGPFSAGGRCR